MSNQESKYFEWGTHSDPFAQYYALSNPSVNRLYYITEDYYTLKQVQLVLMPSRPTIIVRLHKITNYQFGMLDNSVCLNWKVHTPAGQWTMPGYTTDYKFRYGEQLVETTAPSDADIQFQLIVLFLKKVLLSTDEHILHTKLDYTDCRSIDAIKEFCQLLLPTDTNIQTLLDDELKLIKSLEDKITAMKRIVVTALSEINYNNDANYVFAEYYKKIQQHVCETSLEKQFINLLLKI